MVNLKTSDKFEKVLHKIDNSLKIQLDKLLSKLVSNPEIGKPMRFDRKGTREVYLGSFRLSYFYDKNLNTLYLLNLYSKDEQ